MDHFTTADTIDTSVFLRAVNQPDSSTVENFLLPVTGFQENGQSVMPKGFGSSYDLYLTIQATGDAGVFTSLNVTLWADPKANDGTPSVSEGSDPAFSNGTANDIVLATGTMVSASLSLDPTTLAHHADFVESLTPTLAGTVLLGGSIQPGTKLEEQLTSPAAAFQSNPQPDGGTINTVGADGTGGTAVVTLDPQGTILLPDVPAHALHFGHSQKFLYGNGQHPA
jgi:hypothetical protein